MYVSPDYLNSGITVVIDGGCKNNQDAASRKAYGSLCVVHNGKKVKSTLDGKVEMQHEFDFGSATNNIAELVCMYNALRYAKQLLASGKITGIITIGSDSLLAINGATKHHSQMGKKHAVHLNPFYEDVYGLALELKGQVEICKMHREDIVRVLGH